MFRIMKHGVYFFCAFIYVDYIVSIHLKKNNVVYVQPMN